MDKKYLIFYFFCGSYHFWKYFGILYKEKKAFNTLILYFCLYFCYTSVSTSTTSVQLGIVSAKLRVILQCNIEYSKLYAKLTNLKLAKRCSLNSNLYVHMNPNFRESGLREGGDIGVFITLVPKSLMITFSYSLA